MRNKLLYLLTVWLLPQCVLAQDFDEQQLEQYEKEAKDLVSFVEYTFNAMGGTSLSPKEKEVIVNQSYLKAFRDKQVQIEDDLIPNREVVTNKDVQAYLKDIDFFFRNVKFEYNIEEVKMGVNEEGKPYITVSANRNLQGINIDGDSVNNNQERFIEINIDEEEQDMKIVSIYTSKLGEREELVRWWMSLSPAWKHMLGKKVEVSKEYNLNEIGVLSDSLYMIGGRRVTKELIDIVPFIRKATMLEEIDISNQVEISHIKPLSELTQLKKLNISGTSVQSIVPLRNLTTLEELDVHLTLVDDLGPLRYCLGIQSLNISSTNIRDIDIIQNFSNLKNLHADELTIDSIAVIGKNTDLEDLSLAGVEAKNFQFLQHLTKLEFLNVSNSNISDLSGLKGMKSLRTLDVSGTPVESIESLSNNTALEFVNLNNTQVSSLMPLANTDIQRIFCDNTNVDNSGAAMLVAEKPECVIIFKSQALSEWWVGISDSWRAVFIRIHNMSADPSTEELHKLLKTDSVNVTGNKNISSLKPLEQLFALEVLMCAATPVSSLEPIKNQNLLRRLDISNTSVASVQALENLKNLEIVNCNHTTVNDISVFRGFEKLRELHFDYTQVGDITTISTLPSFRLGYFDSTYVYDDNVAKVDLQHEEAVIVYKTANLREWWGQLKDAWQDVFMKATDIGKRPTREQLHRLTGLTKFTVKSIIIDDLSPIEEFVRLKELKFNDTQIKSLAPLRSLTNLEVLDCSRNPIEEIVPIGQLANLKVLYLNNTQIDELDPLAQLSKLEELYCSSTEVKRLDPLENMQTLRILDCSNTRVRNLNDIEELPNLESVRCYNTRINSNRIEDFKELNPECEVVFY